MEILILFKQQPLIWLSFALIIGLLIGSFLNVVIYRIPIMLQQAWNTEQNKPCLPINLAKPRSFCPNCKQTIKAWDNIPLASFLINKGKCRHCHQAIALRYPIIEISFAALSLYLAWHFGPTLSFIASLIFCAYLLCLSSIDFSHRLLPDMLTLSLLWIGLIFNLNGLFVPIDQAVIGAIIGYLSFWLIYQIHHAITAKEGMGYGDFKFFAAIGAWVGWQALPVVAFFASLTGLLYAGFLFLSRKQNFRLIPFGPFLAIGGAIVLLFSKTLFTLYLSWIL